MPETGTALPFRRESAFHDEEAPMDATFKTYWILNRETGEVHSLGPMYGGTVSYATRKLEAERLPYEWTLLAPVAEKSP